MSKISCDVTKDLMASYLDGICSEESKRLVEEHLQECASCKRFLEQFQEKDLGKDAPEIDYLKKVRQSMNFWAGFGVLLPVALFLISRCVVFLYDSESVFYYFAMPILMFTGFLVPLHIKKNQVSRNLEKIVTALGIVVLCGIYFWQYMAYRWVGIIISGEETLPYPDMEMGQFIARGNMVFAVLSAVILFVSILKVKSKKSKFILTQNITWLGMCLSLTCTSTLYRLDDFSSWGKVFWIRVSSISAEAVLVTVLMLVVCHIMEKREELKY